jgi:hypothetical protein
MPSSDEVFGATDEQGFQKTYAVDPGMFPNVVQRQKPEVTEEQSNKEADAARYKKTVKLKQVHTKTWDLSNPDEAEDYCNTKLELSKFKEEQVVVTQLEKNFIKCPKNPRYIAHAEWSEYDVKIEDLMEQHIKKEAEDEDQDSQEEGPAGD